MTSDEDAERAVEFLRTSADKAAVAKGNMTLLEGEEKRVLARQMLNADHKLPVELKKAQALCSEEYRVIHEGHAAAVEEDARYRFLREAAEARLELYRTQQANIRGMSK